MTGAPALGAPYASPAVRGTATYDSTPIDRLKVHAATGDRTLCSVTLHPLFGDGDPAGPDNVGCVRCAALLAVPPAPAAVPSPPSGTL